MVGGNVLLALLSTAAADRPVVYSNAKWNLINRTNVKYGEGLTCTDKARTKCKPMDLLLDSYIPDDGGKAPRPAYIMMHGGGWRGSNMGEWTRTGGYFYGSRGFAAFAIQYRVAKDQAPYPKTWPDLVPGAKPSSRQLAAAEYGATRDLKAAIRYVRANAAELGVDPTRIAIGGGSAGAISAIAAGVVGEDDYKTEITDSTLNSTYPQVSSKVSAVVSHWGAGYGETAVQDGDPKKRSRYNATSAPIIEWHGDADKTVPFADAQAVQTEYNKVGATYEMNVMKGCGHSSWCNGCPELAQPNCMCKSGPQDGPPCYYMDRHTLPFLVTHMDLDLHGPVVSGCVAQLVKDGCDPEQGGQACGACAGQHRADLESAGCNQTFVTSYCEGKVPPAPSGSCETALDSLCPVAVDPGPGLCRKCAEAHVLALTKAGCGPEEVAQLCHARTKRDNYVASA
eukprot:COSAG06_NODE_7866_length_2348_cov_2.260560_1_plen_453_part_00